MLNHPTGLFSGDYNSALRGCWPLKFLHTLQLPKMYFKSYLGRRAALCWALPHISSYVIFCLSHYLLYLLTYMYSRHYKTLTRSPAVPRIADRTA